MVMGNTEARLICRQPVPVSFAVPILNAHTGRPDPNALRDFNSHVEELRHVIRPYRIRHIELAGVDMLAIGGERLAIGQRCLQRRCAEDDVRLAWANAMAGNLARQPVRADAKHPYRWNADATQAPRSWYIDVDEVNHQAEIAFLAKEIYQREISPLTRQITAYDRFSDRV
jgi:hypothetical protein